LGEDRQGGHAEEQGGGAQGGGEGIVHGVSGNAP
jgi:hypothetical protein